jgi:PAS domain S-box-containing protein
MALTSTSPPENRPSRIYRGVPPEEIRITILYMFIGAVYFAFTDQLMAYLYEKEWDWYEVAKTQSGKNMLFIVLTGLILFLVLHRSFRRRRRAEEALQLSNERFGLAARVTTDVIYDWETSSSHIWWSDGFYSLFGYARQEVESTRDFWIRHLHPDEQENVVNSLRQAVAGTGDTWSCEYRFRRKDGAYASIQDKACVLRNPSGLATRVIGGMSDVTERKEAHERIEQSRRQLRALSARLESLREEERTRISREVHDELGQLLTALKMDLRWIEKRIGERENDPALLPVLEKAVEAGEVADRAMSTVQKISSELRPGTLDNLGLTAALRHEAAKFQEHTGIACAMRLPEDSPELPQAVATAVFRIFQETLTNVARHAGASQVQAALRVEADQLVLEVRDNGRGISPEALDSPKSLGLLGMKERAAVLGGKLLVERFPAGGTVVTFQVPRSASDTQFWDQIQI